MGLQQLLKESLYITLFMIQYMGTQHEKHCGDTCWFLPLQRQWKDLFWEWDMPQLPFQSVDINTKGKTRWFSLDFSRDGEAERINCIMGK